MSRHERQISEQAARMHEQEHFVDQVIASGMITDFALRDALLRVDRKHFMPVAHEHLAYQNTAVSLHEAGEIALATISEPVLVAQMIQALHLKKEDRVLELGTGTGYSAAIMSYLCHDVYTIERIPELANTAMLRLKHLGHSNVHVFIGDGVDGYERAGKYDAIVSTVGMKSIPRSLLDQLAVGGRILMPVGDDPQNLSLMLGKKMVYGMEMMDIGRVRFVPLITVCDGIGWSEEEARLLLTPQETPTPDSTQLETLAQKRGLTPQQYSIHLAALMGFTPSTPQSVIESTLNWMGILNAEEDDTDTP